MGVSNQYVIPLSWRNMALVIVGGIALWGIPWLVWPLGSVPPVKAERYAIPVFRYIRVAQGLDGSTWSPVLMPLPTPDGFSKKADVRVLPNKSLVSVLKPNISGPIYLTMESGQGGASAVPAASFLRPVEFNPESSQESGSNLNGGVTPYDTMIQFDIQDSLRNRQFEFAAMQPGPSNGANISSIMVTAVVEIDNKGLVQHVLLEQPAGIPAVDSSIVRGLRAGRGQPGVGNTWGRIRVFYWKNVPVQKE